MIVVAGESLIDVVVDHDGDSSETPGGSPLNVAVGLAPPRRPHHPDQPGRPRRAWRAVVQHVTSSDAEIVAVPTSIGRTSVATAHLDETGAARYDFDLEWSLPRQALPPCRALHVGSLGTAARARPRQRARPGRAGLRARGVRQLRRQPARVVRRRPRPDLARRARRSRRGARWSSSATRTPSCSTRTPTPTTWPAPCCGGERTQLVLLTRGAGGATAFSADGRVRAPAPARSR